MRPARAGERGAGAGVKILPQDRLSAAAMLGLQTYVTVPLVNADGDLEGTLCGASRNRVALGPETLRVMERFARAHLAGRCPEGSL